MTNLEELKSQFEKEDGLWKREMRSYSECVNRALEKAKILTSLAKKIS